MIIFPKILPHLPHWHPLNNRRLSLLLAVMLPIRIWRTMHSRCHLCPHFSVITGLDNPSSGSKHMAHSVESSTKDDGFVVDMLTLFVGKESMAGLLLRVFVIGIMDQSVLFCPNLFHRCCCRGFNSHVSKLSLFDSCF